jgi:hypothetical protein
MSTERLAAVLALIDQRMQALLLRPDGWGTPESVELQLLLLIELRHAATGAPENEIDEVNDRYASFLARELPGPPTSLAARLGLSYRANAQFISLLCRFIVEERTRYIVSMAITPKLPNMDEAGIPHILEA